jgi:hypothetical protein
MEATRIPNPECGNLNVRHWLESGRWIISLIFERLTYQSSLITLIYREIEAEPR